VTNSPTGTEIPIGGVDLSVFQSFLRFVYTDEIHTDSDDETSRDFRVMLEVADRFGCTRMKLLAEYELIKAGIDETNAADLLVFADAHWCALLREAAIDLFRVQPNLIMASAGWTKVAESVNLMQELMKIIASSKEALCSDSVVNPMRVSDLRKKLEEKRLDVDGTHQMLVNRLANA
jgi:hypothetical protein